MLTIPGSEEGDSFRRLEDEFVGIERCFPDATLPRRRRLACPDRAVRQVLHRRESYGGSRFTIWSAVTCHRFAQATCRRRACRSVSLPLTFRRWTRPRGATSRPAP